MAGTNLHLRAGFLFEREIVDDLVAYLQADRSTTDGRENSRFAAIEWSVRTKTVATAGSSVGFKTTLCARRNGVTHVCGGVARHQPCATCSTPSLRRLVTCQTTCCGTIRE